MDENGGQASRRSNTDHGFSSDLKRCIHWAENEGHETDLTSQHTKTVCKIMLIS